MKRGLAVIPALLAVLVASHAAAAVRIRRPLMPTGVDPDARGRVLVAVRRHGRGMAGKMVVAVGRLDGRTTYEITISGVRVGQLLTSRLGGAKVRFSTSPRRHAQLLGVDPRGRRVAVHDLAGRDVLETDVPSKGIDPAEIRCCLASHDEGVCDTRTPERCDAEGGEDLGPGSCLPNPCESFPGEDVMCCIPDVADEPECDLESAAECSEEGGITVGAGECDPDPCAPSDGGSPGGAFLQ